MSDYRVASRYAKSIIELANEKGVLEQVKDDMLLLKETADQNNDFSLLLKSPVIKHSKKATILKMLFDGKVHEMTSLFFNIICNKNREAILETVAEAFIHQYNSMKGIQRASVVSAIPLTADLKAKVEATVTSITGKKEVELTESIDESLIGGYVLTVDDRQIDDSVKGRLDGLRSELI